MKVIAHRGGMQRELQNSPAGVRLAAQHRADFVELDIARNRDGSFHCAHGLGKPSALRDCLVEIPTTMGLIAHLKGSYEAADLLRLAEVITRHLPLTRVIFASHRTSVLGELQRVMPEAQLARFGLFPAITALWKPQPWKFCLINQSVLLKWHVHRLQQKGYVVYASCVWELRSRWSVQRLGVDGVFVNLISRETDKLIKPSTTSQNTPMTLLPANSTDAEILQAIDAWVTQLEQEDYAAALAMIEHQPGWTPGLLCEIIKGYGDALPTQRVTLEARRTDVSQRKNVDRWDDAPNGTLGEVWYDLGIDGLTSDLTATFRILPRDGGIVFHLNDIHVM